MDDTYVKLGLLIDGIVGIKFFIDGKLVKEEATTSIVPVTDMVPTFHFVNGSAAAQTMNIDYYMVVKER